MVQAPAPAGTREHSERRSSMRSALVVDDDADTVHLISTVLREEGIPTTGLQHPLRVFDAVKALRPAVVVLDVVMPVLDGWDELRLLGLDAATRHVPVILLSAWPGALVAPGGNGTPEAFATLVKPFAIEELLGLVHAAFAA
jgi:CheY-like chemotaxis protein